METPLLKGELTPTLPQAQQLALSCFRAPTAGACGAIYIVTARMLYQSLSLPRFYVMLANQSAASLKRWLPGARTSVVISRGDSSSNETLPAEVTSAFDQVIFWSRPIGRKIRVSWHEKALMLAASQHVYSKAVFFDADTLVRHADVAYLFAWLALDRFSFMAVPEVPTSRSRRALEGHPIFNTGMLALKTQDPIVEVLMRRWLHFTTRACAALGSHDGLKTISEDALKPFNITDEDKRIALFRNDQFGLALQLTLTYAATGVQDLVRIALPPRFNFRGYGHGSVADIVVDHDSSRKEQDLRLHIRREAGVHSLRTKGSARTVWRKTHAKRRVA